MLRGPDRPGTTSFKEFLTRAEAVAPDAGSARAAGVCPATTAATSCSRRVRPARPRVRCYDTARACGPTTRGQRWSDLREGDRYLIVNPFFHAFGLKAGILASVIKGATMVPHPVFDVPSVMKRVDEERISMLPGPPAIYQTILDHPDLGQYDLSTLRLAVTGSAAVPVEMINRMRRELTFETIVTGYGLTETTGIATMCRHDDDPEIISTTAGRAIPDVEVWVVDDDGDQLPPGEPGEIVVRGYNLMTGYFNDPEATAAADRCRRVVAHRRRRRARRGGQSAHHRPHQGHVHRRRLQRVSGRDREHDDAESQRRSGGRGRRARSPYGRGGHGLCRGPSWRGADGGRR